MTLRTGFHTTFHRAGDYCSNWYPDGFTDSFVPSCVEEKYQNPPFTAVTLSIWPIPPVGGQEWLYLYSPEFPCSTLPTPQRFSQHPQEANDFKVYPVPSIDELYIVNATVGENLYIYNLIGKVIQQGVIESKNQIINIKNLASGSYYIRIGSNGAVNKIIKME